MNLKVFFCGGKWEFLGLYELCDVKPWLIPSTLGYPDIHFLFQIKLICFEMSHEHLHVADPKLKLNDRFSRRISYVCNYWCVLFTAIIFHHAILSSFSFKYSSIIKKFSSPKSFCCILL